MAKLHPRDFGIGRLFWSIPEAVIVGDAAGGRILLWNPAAEAMFGYSAVEAVGQLVEMLVPEELRPLHRAGLVAYCARGASRAMNAGQVLELIAVRRSGERLPIELSLSPVTSSSIEGCFVLAVIRDISERKQAEAERLRLLREAVAYSEARQARERLAFLAEASHQLAASLDYQTTLANVAQLAVPFLADLCIVDVVAEHGVAERVEVATSSTERGQVAARLREYPPDFAAASGPSRVLRTGEPELIPEVTDELLRQSTRDDEHFQVVRRVGMRSVIRVPLLARGRTIGAMSFCSIESGRRYCEVDLELAQDLANRCALAVDNARLFAEARRAITTRDDFLAFASHDLKSPLTSIKANAQLARRRAAQLADDDASYLVDRMEKIDQTASRMSGLIDELLDVSQLQVGAPLALVQRPTNLVALVHRAVNDAQDANPERSFVVEHDGSPLVGQWDEMRLQRVLANLLNNAVKYSPHDSDVVVALGRERDQTGAWAFVEVRDRGIGIPATDLPRIFERFHRASNVSRRVAGTGLGLPGARQIIEQHGGTIAVASQEGQGATVIVRLPLHLAGS